MLNWRSVAETEWVFDENVNPLMVVTTGAKWRGGTFHRVGLCTSREGLMFMDDHTQGFACLVHEVKYWIPAEEFDAFLMRTLPGAERRLHGGCVGIVSVTDLHLGKMSLPSDIPLLVIDDRREEAVMELHRLDVPDIDIELGITPIEKPSQTFTEPHKNPKRQKPWEGMK